MVLKLFLFLQVQIKGIIIWTIMSAAYNHLRQKRGATNSGLGTPIQEEVKYRELLEAMGYQSAKWKVLLALQGVFSAVQLQGESSVTATPSFPNTRKGTTSFWCNEQGLTVFLWDSLS